MTMFRTMCTTKKLLFKFTFVLIVVLLSIKTDRKIYLIPLIVEPSRQSLKSNFVFMV